MSLLPEGIARWARARRRVKAAYREVFDSPGGQIVLRDLVRQCGLFSVSLEVGAPDKTGFNDGRRSVLLDILKELRWSEAQIMQLALERDPDALGADAEEPA